MNFRLLFWCHSPRLNKQMLLWKEKQGCNFSIKKWSELLKKKNFCISNTEKSNFITCEPQMIFVESKDSVCLTAWKSLYNVSHNDSKQLIKTPCSSKAHRHTSYINTAMPLRVLPVQLTNCVIARIQKQLHCTRCHHDKPDNPIKHEHTVPMLI